MSTGGSPVSRRAALGGSCPDAWCSGGAAGLSLGGREEAGKGEGASMRRLCPQHSTSVDQVLLGPRCLVTMVTAALESRKQVPQEQSNVSNLQDTPPHLPRASVCSITSTWTLLEMLSAPGPVSAFPGVPGDLWAQRRWRPAGGLPTVAMPTCASEGAGPWWARGLPWALLAGGRACTLLRACLSSEAITAAIRTPGIKVCFHIVITPRRAELLPGLLLVCLICED